MKIILSVILIAVLMICQSCSTAKLWDDTNPNERVWIDADKITETTLKQRGMEYQPYTLKGGGKGYLVRKSNWGKMKDYQLRMLGTPVTLVVDAATTVIVVGVGVVAVFPEAAGHAAVNALNR